MTEAVASERVNLAAADSGANVNAHRTFTYKTAGTASACEATSYFDLWADILNVGDWILATTTTGGTAEYHVYAVVSISAADVVVVKDVFAAHA